MDRPSDLQADLVKMPAGAFQSLQRLKQYCDLVVVTSRQNAIQDATRIWLDQHYPQTFREVFFGNHFAKEGATRSKSEICRCISFSLLGWRIS